MHGTGHQMARDKRRHTPADGIVGLSAGAPVVAQQVDLVDDQQADLLYIAAVLPIAADAVPLLGRRDDHIRRLQRPATRKQ